MNKEVRKVISVQVELVDEVTPAQLSQLIEAMDKAAQKVLGAADKLGVGAVRNWASVEDVVA